LEETGQIQDLAALTSRRDVATLVCRDHTSEDCPACILACFELGGFFLIFQ